MKRSLFLEFSAYLCCLVAGCSGMTPSGSGNTVGGANSAVRGATIVGGTSSASGSTGGSANSAGNGGTTSSAGVGGATSEGGTGGSPVVPGTTGGSTGNVLAVTGGTQSSLSTGGSTSKTAGTGGSVTAGGSGAKNTGGSNTTSSTGGANPGTGGSTQAGSFEAISTAASCRKVKNLLVGLACTDADIATLNQSGIAGLKTLINTWMTDATFKPFFQGKMTGFFRNAFQQVGFVPTEDFKHQLLENGGFDFGPLGSGAVGDDAYFRLIQNLQDSFALTALQTVAEGHPLTDVLTTQRYMMTTALKSLYLQIEMPNDQPYSFGISTANKLQWKVEYSTRDIPLANTLNPSSPDYMIFSDLAPTKTNGFTLTPTCQGDGQVRAFTGYAQLFQRLLGFTPRYPYVGSPDCWEHASKPYYTTADLTDWQWVTIRKLNSGEKLMQPYDLPTLRTVTTLPLNLPRVGFFTTPAFMALWQTNNSNQHRVTANQTLLVAFNQTFTPDNLLIPLNPVGLDSNHATTGSQCYGCHKNLDPMREFWETQYDFNDRNDFLTNTFSGNPANPRPSTTGGVLAWDNVNSAGGDIVALSNLLTQVLDQADPNQSINRFAMSMAQKLCYYANSSECVESDPEYRRIALAFANSSYNFGTLITELFSSPLVTNASDTATFDADGVVISISRRDHLCASLSNRLGVSDICALQAPVPSTTQAATLKIAGSVAADAFSRGSQTPVTPSPATLFYRAGTEMLCENVAALVVDATTGSVYASSSATSAIDAMVQNIVGYPPGDAHYASALDILTRHYNDAQKTPYSATKTNALRSTFSLACQSPTSLGIGM